MTKLLMRLAAMENVVMAALIALTCIFMPTPSQGSSTSGHPGQRCVHIIHTHRWQAGDLCDTLPPSTSITAQQWAGYNLDNGWKLVWFDDTGDGCWNTSATTNEPYVLCWDGRIKKGATWPS